jgi:hypothetical protein
MQTAIYIYIYTQQRVTMYERLTTTFVSVFVFFVCYIKKLSQSNNLN